VTAELYSTEYSLDLISVRGSVNPSATVRLESLSKLKESNGHIGTGTYNLPASSILRRPNTIFRVQQFMWHVPLLNNLFNFKVEVNVNCNIKTNHFSYLFAYFEI
jgi:hypothetical protein